MPATAASRSPSPAAAPPVAGTPGPRAANLLKLYNNAVSHTLDSCSYDNFAACFPTPARVVPESLQGLHQDFLNRLGERCKDEFETILQERNVVPALNDLDRLVEDARKRKAKADSEANGGPVMAPTAPHTLPASSLYISHIGSSLQVHHAELTGQMQALQEENARLFSEVQQQRKEIEQVVVGLEVVVSDLDESVSCLTHDEMLALTSDAMAMDQEARAGD